MSAIANVLKASYNLLPEINRATLSGAIDVVVAEQKDGSLKCTPFHVRFGKFRVLRPRDRIVTIEVNGKLTDLRMKLGTAGEAFFCEETDEPPDETIATSPLPLPMTPPIAAEMELASSPLDLEAPEVDGEPRTDDNTPYGSPPSSEGGSSEQKRWYYMWTWGRLPKRTANLTEDSQGGMYLTDLLEQQPKSERDELNDLEQGVSTSPKENTGTTTPHSTSPGQLGALEDGPGEEDVETEGGTPRRSWLGSLNPFRRNRSKELEEDGEDDDPTALSDGPTPLAIDPEAAVMDEAAVTDDAYGGFYTPNETLDPETDRTPKVDRYISLPDVKEHPEEDDNSLDATVAQPASDSTPVATVRSDAIPIPKRAEVSSASCQGEEAAATKHVLSSDEVEVGAEPRRGVGEDEELDMSSDDDDDPSHDFVDAQSTPGEHGSPQAWLADEDMWDALQTSGATREPLLQIALCRDPSAKKNKPVTVKEANDLFDRHILSFDEFVAAQSELMADPALFIRLNHRIYPATQAMPMLISLLAFGKCREPSPPEPAKRGILGWFSWGSQKQGQSNELTGDATRSLSAPLESTGVEASISEEESASTKPAETFVRMSLTPTSEQLEALNLGYGPNAITFSLFSENGSTAQQVQATIYLWPADSKIVVSDIDGTITKSDVLGHIMPLVGQDWAQAGVATLLDRIKENGYHILYLTARPIGQAGRTRSYLQGVQQNGINIPDGPVLTSPDRLVQSFHREVIRRQPQEFKIACLKNVANLFSDSSFHAGFGNRGSDETSYRAVNIPSSRIFTVNPSGEISNGNNHTYKSTYDSLRSLADYMFPCIDPGTGKEQLDEYFNDVNFWRPPMYFPPDEEDNVSRPDSPSSQR